MRALNTSPSASSYVSPSVLPARAGLGVCEPEFALVSLGWAVCVAGGVLLPPAGLSRCTVALARPLLLLAGGSCRTLRVRVACEVASDFACDLPLLPEEAELDSSSRFARVPVDGLTGWADSYFPLSLVSGDCCRSGSCRMIWIRLGAATAGASGSESGGGGTPQRGRDCPPSPRGRPQRRPQHCGSGACACRAPLSA